MIYKGVRECCADKSPSIMQENFPSFCAGWVTAATAWLSIHSVKSGGF